MDVSNSTVCYEAIQRIYRNAVVGHLRVTFKQNFPDSWKKQLVHTVGTEEWSKNCANVNERSVSGELRAKTSDDFDFLDLAHFYNLFDKHFDMLFPAQPGSTPKELARRKKSYS
jgi:hypothetical protein